MTSGILHAVVSLLYSAFIRIPEPCLGPAAFYQFWARNQTALSHLDGPIPDNLKAALHACPESYGITLPSEIALSIESQTASQAHARHVKVTTQAHA